MADFTEYVPNVQQYHAEADDAAVKGIVRHCGIALRNRDSSLVSGSGSLAFCKFGDFSTNSIQRLSYTR